LLFGGFKGRRHRMMGGCGGDYRRREWAQGGCRPTQGAARE
jgi:hypothetical protein